MTPRQRTSLLERALIAYARGFPIDRGKLRAVNALWRVANGRRDPVRTSRLRFGGFEMACDLRQMIQRQIYYFGTFQVERLLLEVWEEHVRGARVVFDVGANCGIFSLLSVSSSPDVQVHAFEPTPEIAAHLRQTCLANRIARISIHEMALGDIDDHVTLVRSRGGGDNDGMNFITKDAPDEDAERVRMRTIGGICADNGLERIDMLKLDVQGQEPAVLAGAQNLLRRRAIDLILLELNWWGDEDERSPAGQCIEILNSHGYRFASPSGVPAWRAAGPWLRKYTDVLSAPIG